MDKRDRRKVGGGSRKHERKNQQIPNHIYLLAIAFLLLVVVGMIFVIRRYTPTKEHMSLSDYFTLTEENQAAVILNLCHCDRPGHLSGDQFLKIQSG